MISMPRLWRQTLYWLTNVIQLKTLLNDLQRFSAMRAVVFLCLLLAFSACKDENLIGLEIHPEGSLDHVAMTDSLKVLSRTILSDANQSSELNSFIGRLQNDAFGTSTASLYFNLALASSNTEGIDPSDYIITDVKLSIRPWTIYGDVRDRIDIDIYELEEQIFYDSSYTSDVAFRLDDQPVGSFSLEYPSLSAYEDSLDTASYRIEIDLDRDLGEHILQGYSNVFATTEAFQQYFKGLAMVVNESSSLDNGGIIYNLLLTGGNTYLTISTERKNDTGTVDFYFPVTGTTARVNAFEHDHSGAEIEGYLKSELGSPEKVFVQGLSGTKAEIHIPELYDLGATRELSLHKAVIQVPSALEQPDGLEHSPQMYLLDYEVTDGDTIETFTIDYLTQGVRHNGSFVEDSSFYEFDVTRQIQKILKEAFIGNNINYGFTLNAQVPVINGNVRYQNVLLGSDNIVLRLYYTDIKE